MNARNVTVAVAVLVAAGRVLAGDIDSVEQFGDRSQFMSANTRVEVPAQSAQAPSTSGANGDFVDAQLAGAGYLAGEREYAKGHSASTQGGLVAHSDNASMRSREEVRAEATQAAKDRMVKGVSLLPGDAW